MIAPSEAEPQRTARLQEAHRFWELARQAGTDLLKHGITLATGIVAALYVALTQQPPAPGSGRVWAARAVVAMGVAVGGGLLAWAADVGLHSSWAYRIYNHKGPADTPIQPQPAWRWLRIAGVAVLVLAFLFGVFASARFVLSAV